MKIDINDIIEKRKSVLNKRISELNNLITKLYEKNR